MPHPTYYLGIIDKIVPSADGDPGERTFLLQLEGIDGTARLWLEKEQLLELAQVSEHMYDMFNETSNLDTHTQETSSINLEHTDFECQIGRFSLYHNPEQDLFVIEADEISYGERSGKAIEFLISLSQLSNLSSQAFMICAAGRPYCDLCGLPMDPDFHICPRSTWVDEY